MPVLHGLGGRSKIWDTAPAALNTSFKCKDISDVIFEGRSISMAMKSTDHSKEVSVVITGTSAHKTEDL